MKIRTKIIWIVIPLLISALFITGIISSFSARSGLTRLAMDSLGFKAQELKKNMDNQWNLLVSNNFSESPEYVAVAKGAVASYARSIIRSPSELIFAVNEKAAVVMSSQEVKLGIWERSNIVTAIREEKTGWTELRVEDKLRVGQSFFFEPFGWYVFVTEEQEVFSREATQILMQTAVVLGVSTFVSLILLLIFTGVLTRPLSRVANAMRAIISTNDLSSRVAIEYNDEIGELAHTFNIMVSELQRAYDQIKEFAFKAVLAQKNEHKIRNIFQRYVPKDVIEGFFTNPESMLVGENRVLAILFSDIRSFTTISEGFMPDELVYALNNYFEIMVDIIMGRGGIVDKYIGDAIMAFYGAPIKHEDDALQAVLSALEMQRALKDFNREQEASGKPAFITGIGVNYGVVTVGNIGSERKMDYTIIGDMVNLGSRLEGMTKPYKQEIIFSESVYRKVKTRLPCRLIDKVVAKGKTSGEKIFTAKQELTDSETRGWQFHHSGLKLYYQREFTKALQYFEGVQKVLPGDHISGVYIDRCRHYFKNPPAADWQGVEILTSK
ncbi:MAG: adenylate/guanylate cyclase domain-containing protein [Spirochaetales bacterium]|nr:adenylate/guanylate cyclase domain-containing protein [Spirochaetales bacterium]